MPKKNPQDSTRRNVQAANKKLAVHDSKLKKIGQVLVDVWRVGARVQNLEALQVKLESRVAALEHEMSGIDNEMYVNLDARMVTMQNQIDKLK